MDIWVVDVWDVVSCILGRERIQLSKQDEFIPFLKDRDKEETTDKEPDVQYINSSKVDDELKRPLHEEDIIDDSSIYQDSMDWSSGEMWDEESMDDRPNHESIP